MIFGVFADRDHSRSAPSLFRGFPLEFWIARSFPGIEFFPDGVVPEGTGNVLICPPDKLPVARMNPEEVVAWIQSRAEKGEAFSFSEGLFRVRPAALWKKGETPLPDPVAPDFSLELLDPVSDPLQVESRVLALQVQWLKRRGVQVEDPLHFFMEGLQNIGAESVLSSGVVIRGKSRVGKGVRIMPYCFIEDSEIGDGCTLLPGCVIRNSSVGPHAQLGPYSHLRQQANIGASARIGNFVEIKKSDMGKGSKASHLSYLGDATIGTDVNIGAGTITCNYDGESKHPTFIEDGVFIGSGTELVAPVHLHRNSFVAAGSTVTEDVPENALALSRQRQRNLLGWRLKRDKRTKSKKSR